MGENIAIRDTYGAALKELGEQNEKTVDPETDVASSTRSRIFGRAFPECYSDVGINELDIVSTSAGFAREGLIPYVNTFTAFLVTRGANPTWSLITYNKLSVKLYGTYCGLSNSHDEASHQTITDPAFVRTIPNMTVITMAGAVETKKAVFTIAEHQSPVYLRLSRTAAPVFYPKDMKFGIGRGITVRENGDVTIVTMGTVLHKALAAAEFLEAKGVRAGVVDMHTIRPIDEELIIECAREAGATVTMEEHSICGGLGSAVAEAPAERMSASMARIGTTDLAESRDYGQLLAKYGYGPESIAERCEKVTECK